MKGIFRWREEKIANYVFYLNSNIRKSLGNAKDFIKALLQLHCSHVK